MVNRRVTPCVLHFARRSTGLILSPNGILYVFYLILLIFGWYNLYFQNRRTERCPKCSEAPHEKCPQPHNQNHSGLLPLNCAYCGRTLSECYLSNDGQVLIPFTAIKGELELSGGMKSNGTSFHIEMVNSEIPSDSGNVHEAIGYYMDFYKLDVESRPHVNFINTDQGVPESNQWDRRGYMYTNQIGQFGLSHYSKFYAMKLACPQSDGRRDPTVDLDVTTVTNSFVGHRSSPSETWFPASKPQSSVRSYVFMVSDHENSSNPTDLQAATFPIPSSHGEWKYLVLSGRDWHVGSAVKLVFESQITDPKSELKNYELIYACRNPSTNNQSLTDRMETSHTDRRVIFWISSCSSEPDSSSRIQLTRDVLSDLSKAFMSNVKSSIRPEKIDDFMIKHINLKSISLHVGVTGAGGGGVIDELFVATGTGNCAQTISTFHERRFLSAADWFVKTQRADGCFPIPVIRSLRGRSDIPAGWCSSMGQGHGISLLVRAYSHTKNKSYMHCAEDALRPFTKLSEDGGVLSHVLQADFLPWYEEYPTIPSNHVLNGFIYSLLGLYDLAVLQQHHANRSVLNASELWQRGLRTLSAVLAMYDSGSGSFYDLRHLVTPLQKPSDKRKLKRLLTFGPTRARWSYHVIHVQQLRLLSKLDPTHSEQWSSMAARWSAYMSGHRSIQN